MSVVTRQFSREFKFAALKLVKGTRVAVRQDAQDFDVHEKVPRQWVREFREQSEGHSGNGKMTMQAAEIARFRKEVGRLETARDLLKKAALPLAKEPI